jgi:transcriptional regulator with XRE-family HTH domain
MNNIILKDPYDWINDTTKDTRELFELDDLLYSFSITLFDYRNDRSMSQKQLAEILGVSQAMISKLESGEYNPSMAQLWKIAKKLDLDFRITFREKSSSAVVERISSTVSHWSKSNTREKINLLGFNRKLGASA